MHIKCVKIMKLKELKPSLLWHYFDILTTIPRPSGSEERVAAWLIEFAKEHSLAWRQDQAGNVMISAPATSGREDAPVVTLQAHMDMVCEKRSTSAHNFESDPLEVYIEDGWVRARDTTLGADCGIGVAAALAALSDPDLEHGALEALFTVDEERGLTGAFGLGEGMIGGDILINLDSEDEGEIFIGCAGGVDTTAIFNYTPEPIAAECELFRLTVGGLLGGHSGDDINKGRANAVKTLARLLFEGALIYGVRLVEMDCGNLKNAIPREGWATLAIESSSVAGFKALFEGYCKTIANECLLYDPAAHLTLESEVREGDVVALDMITQFSLLGALVSLPNGVMAMSEAMVGLVESSSNLAAVKFIGDNKIKVVTSQRSSATEGRERVKTQIHNALASAGAEVSHSNGYPGWSPNPDSKLLSVAQSSYRELFGEDAKVRAIHAGLECGLFLERNAKLDMISFGPTMTGVHSPDERLLVSSVERFWAHLAHLLSHI